MKVQEKNFRQIVMEKIRWILLGALIVIGAVFLLAGGEVRAEGSKELNMTDDEANAYRAFLEWDPTLSEGGVLRTTVLKLIMKQGETVCLGTSVTGAADGDILVRCQIDGNETKLYANASSGVGYIRSRTMELAGPNYDGNNPAGYKPLIFEAPYTGVYELEFHSKVNGTDHNPAPMVLSNLWGKQGASVAAWDATVIGYDGKPVQGRLFSNYLAINTGTEDVGMYSSLHVLTTDGYQYNLETNGIGPWGFILYANNVGLLNGPTGLSLYKNAVLKDKKPTGGVVVPTPDWHNTLSVFTHRIFLNDPDDEIATLLSDFPLTPQPMAEIKSFSFVGNKDGDSANKTEVGAGGTFYLTVSEHCTFDIIIDTNKDGVFDPHDDVMLPAPASKGDNAILWDGKDHNGINVEASTYKMQLRLHGGEFHFPMFDAERCPHGLKITLMNPSAYQTQSGYDPTIIYWDSRDYTTYSGISITQSGTKPPDPIEALEGISSKNGAFAYGDNKKGGGSSQFGNDKIMDVWTYALGDPTDTRIIDTIEIGIEPATTGSQGRGAIMATLFFDSDRNGAKIDSEKYMPGVKVALYKDAAKTDPVLGKDGQPLIVTSNSSGRIVFNDIPYDATSGAGNTYYLFPDPVVDGVTHTITTGTYQSVVLKGPVAYSHEIGLYTEHDVGVTVMEDKTEIFSGEEITFTVTVTNTKANYLANNTVVRIPVPNVSGVPEVVSVTQGIYANGKWDVGKLPVGGSAELKIKMKPTFVLEASDSPTLTEKNITYTATASCDDDDNPANNVSSVTFKVKQRPEYKIVYHANYQVNMTTPEETETEDRSVATDASSLRENTFTRPDYNFMGWSKYPNAQTVHYPDKYNFTGTGGSVIDLYAVWQLHAPDVTVSLTATPGTVTAGDKTKLQVTVKNLKTDPAKDPFVAMSFPNIEGVPVVGGTVSDVTYNPTTKGWRWQPGTIPGNGQVTCEIEVMPAFNGGSASTITFTAQTGCTYDSNPSNNTSTASVTVNPAKEYKITYDPNSGEGTTVTETYEYTTGGKKLKKNIFLKDGYTFLGWSTDSDAVTPDYTDEELYKAAPESDLMLYAVWRKNLPPSTGGGGTTDTDPEPIYSIQYDWGQDIPEGIGLPIDLSTYKTEEEALAALDKYYPAGTKIEGEKDNKKGFWIFSGWTAKAADSSGRIKVYGSWVFEEAGNPEVPSDPNKQTESGKSSGQPKSPGTGDHTGIILLWLICIVLSLTGIIKNLKKNF